MIRRYDGPAIEVAGVSKRFRGSSTSPWRRGSSRAKLALHPLDLTVATGSVTGVIGVNGSGKSTLVRILATLMLPDTGTVRIFGRDLVHDAFWVRRHINRVSVDAAFFKMLSPWENLTYAARLYGVSHGARRRAEALFNDLGLPQDVLDAPLQRLSRGQQQKIAIARSFLTSPTLLLLDEPTTGLDPRSKRDVQQLIDRVRTEHDATVLLCTHDLAEAEALCDRVVVLHQGRRVADGTPQGLRDDHGGIALEEVFLRLTGASTEDQSSDEEVA